MCNNAAIEKEMYIELTEEDFCPPQDDRMYISDITIDDVDGGDNFGDYVRWYYRVYGNDVFGDGWDAEWR